MDDLTGGMLSLFDAEIEGDEAEELAEGSASL
jgi:hypothetical protein